METREQCGVPAGAQKVRCDGVELAVSRTGQGPVVVCLHAVAHGGRDFQAFTEAMSDRFEVIRVDWPGHGRSGQDSQPPSVARYAQLLEMLLAELQVRDPILIGNSIGGGAAIRYAERHPVRGLVLCDSAGLVPVNALVRATVGLFVRFFRAGERGAGWFDRVYAGYYRFLVLPSPAAAEQRARIVRAGRAYASTLRQAWETFRQPEADLRSITAALDVPIWLAWAKQDRVIPLWMCKPAIRHMQQAQLSTFPGGHAAFLECPQAFIDGFLGFVNGLPAAGACGAVTQ